MASIGKVFQERTSFVICEDHFDMVNDVKRTDSRVTLKESVIPHLNIEISLNIGDSKFKFQN